MTTMAPHGRNLLLKLLDFERSPGRFPVALREPRPLFDHIDSVMLLAAGRPVEGLRVAPANEPELQRAARFFVRTVMLRPGADPLTLLGLPPDHAPAQLREHYRLMIRLTHPDFTAQGERWPADAATRINLAKDMLSATPQMEAGHVGIPPSQMGEMPIPARVARVRSLPRPRPLLPRPDGSARDDMGGPPRGWGDAGAWSEKSHWSARARIALIGVAVLLMTGVILLT